MKKLGVWAKICLAVAIWGARRKGKIEVILEKEELLTFHPKDIESRTVPRTPHA